MKLNDRISQIHSTSEKIRNELAIAKNVNTKLEERIISLGKDQAKSDQYSWRNNIDLSGIPNDKSEDNLKKVVIGTCHDSELEINRRTLRAPIVYQYLDIVGTLIKEL